MGISSLKISAVKYQVSKDIMFDIDMKILLLDLLGLVPFVETPLKGDSSYFQNGFRYVILGKVIKC